jgi:hypothetical protein
MKYFSDFSISHWKDCQMRKDYLYLPESGEALIRIKMISLALA